MTKPIELAPLKEVQARVGVHLEHVKGDPRQLLLWLSIAEYLKDAERWQHVAENTVQWNNYEPRTAAEFRNWIDQEIDNERKRLIRPG